MSKKSLQFDWAAYAQKRNLSRNRLLYPWHLELVDDFLREFERIPICRKVLDIGPGNGFFMVLLRELGFTEVHGLEISSSFLEELNSKNLRAYYGDILSGDGLDKLLGPYDVVLMMEVLEHLEDPEAALKNVRSLLSEDGLLYLTVPVCDSVFDRLFRVLRGISRQEQIRRIDETHIHAFSRKDLENILKSAGFAVREVRRLSFKIPRKLRFSKVFLLIRALLPNRFRGSNISIVARPKGQ